MSDSSKVKRIKAAKSHKEYGPEFPGPAMIFFEAVRLEYQLQTGEQLNKTQFAKLLGLSRQNYNGYVFCVNPRIAHLITLVEKRLITQEKLWALMTKIFKRPEYKHLFAPTITEV